jgi:hypothetical protein
MPRQTQSAKLTGLPIGTALDQEGNVMDFETISIWAAVTALTIGTWSYIVSSLMDLLS